MGDTAPERSVTPTTGVVTLGAVTGHQAPYPIAQPAITVAERHQAALEHLASGSSIEKSFPPVRKVAQSDEFPPRVRLDELTPERLQNGIDAYGCVLVPSLVPEDVASELVDGIDRVFDAYDRFDGTTGTGDPWFDAYIPEPGSIHATRPWLREGGGIFTPDSPRMTEHWFNLLGSLGIVQLITGVFGERPVTSLDKCALRRIRSGDGIEWHQDGSFLGVDSGALNLWVSLSNTSDSPGLDIVGHRFTEIVETGTGGARYDWSTGPDVVADLAGASPIEQPHFRVGDALIFDGLLLHRTSQPPPELSMSRYAIETWFFRPTSFPRHQEIPIAI